MALCIVVNSAVSTAALSYLGPYMCRTVKHLSRQIYQSARFHSEGLLSWTVVIQPRPAVFTEPALLLFALCCSSRPVGHVLLGR